MCDVIGEAPAGLPALLSSVGQVMRVELIARQGEMSAIVQSARDRACDACRPHVRRAADADLCRPLFGERLGRPPAGLLQASELGPCAPGELRASPASAHSRRQRSRPPPDSSWDSCSSSVTRTHISAPMAARLCMDTTAGSRASREANRRGAASQRLLTRENWIVRLASDGRPGLTFRHPRELV
jgi:hypothetical protein